MLIVGPFRAGGDRHLDILAFVEIGGLVCED